MSNKPYAIKLIDISIFLDKDQSQDMKKTKAVFQLPEIPIVFSSIHP
jgi:hypothetical protein